MNPRPDRVLRHRGPRPRAGSPTLAALPGAEGPLLSLGYVPGSGMPQVHGAACPPHEFFMSQQRASIIDGPAHWGQGCRLTSLPQPPTAGAQGSTPGQRISSHVPQLEILSVAAKTLI